MAQDQNSPEVALAHRITEQADRILEDTPDIQFTQRYVSSLGPEYALELRVSGDTGERPVNLPSRRYLYVNQHGADACCGVVFSVDINSFEGDGEVSGMLSNSYNLAFAAEAAGTDQVDEKELLLGVLEVMRKHDDTSEVPEADRVRIGQLFFDLVDQGSTVMMKQQSLKVAGELGIWISGTFISGPEEHLWAVEMERPRLFIAARLEDDPMHTALQMSQDGLLESFVQLANPIERMAGYADEEDIVRDDNGKVIALSGTIHKENAVVEAERAAGVRDLEMTQLEFINRSLQQALSQL